ncbi:MAG: ECF transporter S component [Lachnospiraceae bacterium]|nr:ECF transporter S component [Lachnospiraceae bacterium]GFI50519.1 pantothenic acid transporter PanT [Lachnospiraceae bacterium]
MKKQKHDTRWMVSVALMAAIVIVLANTPLGMIQLPIIKATTVHIPVILGAILLGPSAGAILGAVFGICSLISNTMAPTLLSFAFSPFMSTTGIPGALKAIWISAGCRILIGVAAGWLWILLAKLNINQIIALPIVGFAGSMVNTVTVMGSIYFLFAQQYADAREVAVSAVWGLIMGTVTASGIPEAIAAAILVLAIGKVLLGVFRKMNIGMVSAQTAK